MCGTSKKFDDDKKKYDKYDDDDELNAQHLEIFVCVCVHYIVSLTLLPLPTNHELPFNFMRSFSSISFVHFSYYSRVSVVKQHQFTKKSLVEKMILKKKQQTKRRYIQTGNANVVIAVAVVISFLQIYRSFIGNSNIFAIKTSRYRIQLF